MITDNGTNMETQGNEMMFVESDYDIFCRLVKKLDEMGASFDIDAFGLKVSNRREQDENSLR